MLQQPIAHHADWHAERSAGQRRKSQQRRQSCPPQARRRRDPPRAGADARIAGLAAHMKFGDQADQTEPDQDERQKGRLRPIQSDSELSIKLRREGAEAQQRKGAELNKGVERDKQHPAKQSWAKLRQDDTKETTPGALTQR